MWELASCKERPTMCWWGEEAEPLKFKLPFAFKLMLRFDVQMFFCTHKCAAIAKIAAWANV